MNLTNDNPSVLDFIRKNSLQLIFSSVGVSAFLYVLGWLATVSKLNMLGIWTSISLTTQSCFHESIIMGSGILLRLVVGLILLSISIFLFAKVFPRWGYSLHFNFTKSITPGLAVVVFTLSCVLLWHFLQPVGIHDLLFKKCNQNNSDYAQFIIFPDEYKLLRFMFYEIQLLTFVFVLLFLFRLWHSNKQQPSMIIFYFRSLFLSLLLLFVYLLPMNYGRLLSSQEYHAAVVNFSDNVSSGNNQLRGFPIIQTNEELVFFEYDSSKSPQGTVLMIKKDLVSSIVFADSSVSIFKIIYGKPPALKEGFNMKIITLISIFLILFLIIIFSFTDKISTKDVQPDQIIAAKDKTDSIGVKTKTDSITTIPVLEDSCKTTWLVQFFPILTEYLTKFGNELVTVLESIDKSFRGDQKSESEIPDLSTLNIFIYDLREKSLDQITNDGGYFSPRLAEDGNSISFIKDGKLWQMQISDRKKTLLDEQLNYQRLLSWIKEGFRFLLTTQEKQLYVLDIQNKSMKVLYQDTVDQTNFRLNPFIELSQTSLSGKIIFENKASNNTWCLIEDSDRYEQAKIIFEAEHRFISPSWSPDEQKIIFVSNK